MKKRYSIIAALLIVAILAPQVNAIGIMGSWWKQDDLKNGYGIGLIHEFGLLPIVTIDARASWLNFSEDGADANVFPLEATGRVKLGMFYGGLGVGYYIFNGGDGVEIDNSVGGYLIGGIGFGLFGLGAFGEVKYTFLDTDINVGTQTNKLEASGVGINLGVTLPF